MILVDTSVWIDFFSRPSSPFARQLEIMIENNQAICINGLIRLEILQGVRDEVPFHKMNRFLSPFLYYEEIKKSYLDTAIEIYRSCRQKGVTIRKSIDCLIAANALVEELDIFHKDRDFTNISKIYKDLKVLNFKLS